MHYSFTLLAFAVTALALPAAKPQDDGSWRPGKYEGDGTGFQDGGWEENRFEGPGTGFDDGNWSPEKWPRETKAKRQDDGTSWPGKYEGPGTGFQDGGWEENRFEGPGTGFDDGMWDPETEAKVKRQDNKANN